MRVVEAEDGALSQRGAPIGELGADHLLGALPGCQGRPDHLGVPPSGLGLGDSVGALTIDTEQMLDRGRPEAGAHLQLEERHDRHLVVAKPVIG